MGAPEPFVGVLHMAAPSIPFGVGAEGEGDEGIGLVRYLSERENKWAGKRAAVAREYRHLVTVKGRRGEVLCVVVLSLLPLPPPPCPPRAIKASSLCKGSLMAPRP